MSDQSIAITSQGTLSSDNEETLQRLVRTIDFAEGLALLFAKCNIPTLRRTLAAEAIQRLREHTIEVVEVEFSTSTSHLRQTLRERLSGSTPPNERKVVFIYGLEHALPRDERSAPLLSELNMGRELFHRDAPYPIVFWLPDYALTTIARGAPDFWAWRSGVFEFETEPVYLREAFQLYARDGSGRFEINNLPVEQKRRRRAVLQYMLSDYEDLEQDELCLRERAEITSKLGMLDQELGELRHARQMYEQSLELNKRLGDQDGILRSLQNLGIVAGKQESYDEARQLFEQSLEISKELHDQENIAQNLRYLGDVALDQEAFEEAADLYQRSKEIYQQLGNQIGVANILFDLAMIARAQEDYGEARRLIQQSLEIGEKIDDKYHIALMLIWLGMLAQDQKEFDESERFTLQGLEFYESIGLQSGIVAALLNLGLIAVRQGEYGEAQQLLEKSLSVSENIGHSAGIAASTSGLELISELLGQPELAPGEG